MQICNKNNISQKQTTFGVKKTDRVQSFINEINATNQNLGNLERLPIVQKMKESDTFEQLKERANANRSMFENKRSFNIANKNGFTTFINSICIKIVNELKELGRTVKKFIVQIEDENGNKKESNVVRAFKIRLSTKASYKKNPEKKKEYDKKYYKIHKDEILKYQKEIRACLNNEKTNFMQLDNMRVNYMSPETQLKEMQSDFMPQIPWPQEQKGFEPMLQTSWEQNQTDYDFMPQISLPREQEDFGSVLPNFQQDPEDDFIL